MAMIETDFGATAQAPSPSPESTGQKNNALGLLIYATGRSRVLIVSLAVLGVLLGFVYGAIRLNVFEARGKLLLRVGVREGSTAETGVTQAATISYPGGKEAMFTELELLASPDLFQTVVNKVGAQRIVEFRDPTSFDDDTTGSLTRMLHRFQSWWFRDMKELDPEEVDIEGLALFAIERGLYVEAAGYSSVIAVSFQGQDKRLAKEIVDAFMQAAEAYHREKFSTRAQLTFQESRLKEARGRARAAEKGLSDYQARQGIFDLDYQKKDLLKGIAELQKAMDTRADQLEELRQRSQFLLSIIEGKNESRLKLLSKIPNPAIARLEKELADWKRTKLTTGTGLEKDRFKREEQMKLINGEIAKLEKQLQMAPRFLSSETNLSQYLDQQYEIESGLLTSNNVLKQEVERMKRMTARLRELQAAEAELLSLEEAARQAKSEADSAASQVESLSLIGLLDEKKMGNLRVLQEATMSREKVAPKRAKFLIFGLILGFGVGLMLALLRALIDPCIRRPAEIESLTASPTLAVVSERSLTRRKGQPLTLVGDDHIPLFEVVSDNCWHPLVQDGLSSDRRRFAILSDDKLVDHGVIAAATALGLAQWTRKPVILVETNFEDPRVAQSFGLDPNRGLSNVLDGSCSIDECLQATDMKNLHVLPAGNARRPMPGWRASARAISLMKHLYQEYHYVLTDVPPLSTDPETHHLLEDADAAMIVTKAGRSKKSTLKELSESLARARVPLVGTVLSGYRGKRIFGKWGSDPELKGIPSS